MSQELLVTRSARVGAAVAMAVAMLTPTLARAQTGGLSEITGTVGNAIVTGEFDAAHYWSWGASTGFDITPSITVVVGEPMHFSEADLQGHGRELYQKLSERVMERIAALSLPGSALRQP